MKNENAVILSDIFVHWRFSAGATFLPGSVEVTEKMDLQLYDAKISLTRRSTNASCAMYCFNLKETFTYDFSTEEEEGG